MTDETQRTLITALASLGGTIVGAISTSVSQAIKDRSTAKRTTLAAAHTDRRDRLNETVGSLLKLDLGVSTASGEIALAQKLQENSQKVAAEAVQAVARLTNDPNSPIVKDTLANIRQDGAKVADRNVEIASGFSKLSELGNEVLLAAGKYGAISGAKGMDGRYLSKDLYELISSRPYPSSNEIHAWRILLRDIVDDLTVLADWENRCANAVKSHAEAVPPVELVHLPFLTNSAIEIRRMKH